MKKLSKKQINKLIKDERHDARMYARLGIKAFARDETKHKNFFKLLKSRGVR